MWGIRPLTGTSATTPEPNATITERGFVHLYGGSNFACGLGSDALASCWGQNENGQLGIGSTASRLVPNLPVGAGLPLAALPLGGGHACGLTAAGKAYCWGINTNGEVGDGTLNDRTTPVAVAPALTFVELAAGKASTCGRTATQEVYCWGRLPGTVTDATTPTLIDTQPNLYWLESSKRDVTRQRRIEKIIRDLLKP